MNASGDPVDNTTDLRETMAMLVRQLTHPVRWMDHTSCCRSCLLCFVCGSCVGGDEGGFVTCVVPNCLDDAQLLETSVIGESMEGMMDVICGPGSSCDCGSYSHCLAIAPRGAGANSEVSWSARRR